MAIKNFKEKLGKVLAERSASDVEAENWRRENRSWLKKSGKIALCVLDALESKGWTQAMLAKEMGVSAQQVSKIVKGHENLSLKTIDKLEAVLGVHLISIESERKQEKETANAVFKATYTFEGQGITLSQDELANFIKGLDILVNNFIMPVIRQTYKQPKFTVSSYNSKFGIAA